MLVRGKADGQTNSLPLATGAHTRSIAVTTPSTASGGIMKFAKKKLACLNCKAPIADGSLCAHCSPKVRQTLLFSRMHVLASQRVSNEELPVHCELVNISDVNCRRSKRMVVFKHTYRIVCPYDTKSLMYWACTGGGGVPAVDGSGERAGVAVWRAVDAVPALPGLPAPGVDVFLPTVGVKCCILPYSR